MNDEEYELWGGSTVQHREDPEQHLVVIEMFHQLHCVVSVLHFSCLFCIKRLSTAHHITEPPTRCDLQSIKSAPRAKMVGCQTC